jgi:hypothetical protein
LQACGELSSAAFTIDTVFEPPLRDRALINELGLREVEVRADRRVIPACHVGMHASLATVILKQADR